MKLVSFEMILYDHITFNEKVRSCAPSLSLRSRKCVEQPISGPHPDSQTNMESLLNDSSAPDGRSDSLYRILTLTTQIYTESLLNNGSAPDGRSTANIGSSS